MVNNKQMIRRSVRGSATVEFVLLASILVPMIVLMPSLAKTTDVNLATTQAARYGAWEQTVQLKSGDDLATEISNRFYAKPDIGIRSEQGAITAENFQNSFWSGAGLGQALLTTDGDTLAVNVSSSDLGGVAGGVEQVIDTLGSILGGDGLDLGGGIYTVNVGVNVSNDQLANLELDPGTSCDGTEQEGASCVQFKSVILVDAWNSRGPAEVESRVKGLVPASQLEPLGKMLSGIGKTLPIFQELESLEDSFGHVAPDVLPEDRYGDKDD